MIDEACWWWGGRKPALWEKGEGRALRSRTVPLRPQAPPSQCSGAGMWCWGLCPPREAQGCPGPRPAVRSGCGRRGCEPIAGASGLCEGTDPGWVLGARGC